jgi:hypothetical protein
MDHAKSTPESEVRQKDDTTLPVWANFPVWIAGTAMCAFILSSLYVASIMLASGFPITTYLDFLDYVQIIPTVLATRKLFCLTIVIIAICITAIEFVSDASRMPKSKKKNPPRRFAIELPQHLLVFKTIFKYVLAFEVFLLFGNTYLYGGPELLESVRQAQAIQVYRKGAPPVSGKLFFWASKNILLYSSKDNLITIVPQTEVQTIERPWTLPFDVSHGSPSPAATATPSGSSQPHR